jgi:ACS family hexuronate transporter-like MFS transporter
MIARFISDPVWWFYIYWLPDYLNTRRGLNIKEIGFAVPLIYIIAIAMGNAFGWLSGRLIKNGWNETRTRKTLMIACAACMPFTAFAASVDSLWAVILLVGLACGSHTGWSANMFALITDQFPSRAVGSVTGISTFTAGVGGLILSAVVVGYMVTYFGYLPVFILMGILHPIAVLFIYFMVRKPAE